MSLATGVVRWWATTSTVLAALGTATASAQPHPAADEAPSGASRSASAETPVSGWVVALDGSDVVVDIGTEHGASPDDTLELWRPVKLKHPVTGRLVTDRFRTGTLKLRQIRDRLSWARPIGTPERDVAVGDQVIFRRAATEPAKTPVAGQASTMVPGSLPPGQWNDLRMVFRGRDVEVYLNEMPVLNTYSTNFWREYMHAPLKGVPRIVVRKGRVEMRKVRVREL